MTTTTTEVEQIPAAGLAITDEQQVWSPQQLAVLQQGGIEEGVTGAELAAFLHICKRRALDPFTRQIYLIGRWDKAKKRKVYTPQTSIDAFRLIARRAADKSGVDYGYEDPVYIDRNGGEHKAWVWNNPPAAVRWVTVRNGMRYPATARYAAYVATFANGDPMGQWKTMGDHMTAKCAEALSLRMAFPEDLGGIYTAEEMQQAENGGPPPGATVVPGHVSGDVEDATPPPKQAAQHTPHAPQRPPQPHGPGPDAPATKELLDALQTRFKALGVATPADGLMAVQVLSGRQVRNSKELTCAEAARLLDELQRMLAEPSPREVLTDRIRQTMLANVDQTNGHTAQGDHA